MSRMQKAGLTSVHMESFQFPRHVVDSQSFAATVDGAAATPAFERLRRLGRRPRRRRRRLRRHRASVGGRRRRPAPAKSPCSIATRAITARRSTPTSRPPAPSRCSTTRRADGNLHPGRQRALRRLGGARPHPRDHHRQRRRRAARDRARRRARRCTRSSTCRRDADAGDRAATSSAASKARTRAARSSSARTTTPGSPARPTTAAASPRCWRWPSGACKAAQAALHARLRRLGRRGGRALRRLRLSAQAHASSASDPILAVIELRDAVGDQATLLGLARSNHAPLEEALQTRRPRTTIRSTPAWSSCRALRRRHPHRHPGHLSQRRAHRVHGGRLALLPHRRGHARQGRHRRRGAHVDDFDKALGLLLEGRRPRASPASIPKLWQATLTAQPRSDGDPLVVDAVITDAMGVAQAGAGVEAVLLVDDFFPAAQLHATADADGHAQRSPSTPPRRPWARAAASCTSPRARRSRTSSRSCRSSSPRIQRHPYSGASAIDALATYFSSLSP